MTRTLLLTFIIAACDLGKDTGDSDLEVNGHGPSPEDTSTEVKERTCSDVPRLDASVATDTSETRVLSCVASGDGETCPELSAMSSKALTPPHTDQWCWYEVEPICGPEATIEDACCYEVELVMVCQ